MNIGIIKLWYDIVIAYWIATKRKILLSSKKQQVTAIGINKGDFHRYVSRKSSKKKYKLLN